MISTVADLEREVSILLEHLPRVQKSIEIHEFDNARMQCDELAKRLAYLNRKANLLADKDGT